MSQASLSTGTRQKIMFKCVTQDKNPVIVVGSVSELGEWNVAGGLPMYAISRPQGGYQWTAQAELQQGQTFEYKFVKKTEQGPRWESGNNRRITVIPVLPTLDGDFRE